MTISVCAVIYQCGLKRDLSLFKAGDQTEIGEKGLTLRWGFIHSPIEVRC
jgi:hypothetical protein